MHTLVPNSAFAPVADQVQILEGALRQCGVKCKFFGVSRLRPLYSGGSMLSSVFSPQLPSTHRIRVLIEMLAPAIIFILIERNAT